MVLGERSDGRIDREKTCPLLLRIFVNQLYHNSIHDYSHKSFPSNELRAYTWLDATLCELSDLIKSVHPDTKKLGTTFEFAIVSPEPTKPIYRMRSIGNVRAGIPSDSDKIMLKDCTFRIGDMLDVSITPSVPSSDGRSNANTGGIRAGFGRQNDEGPSGNSHFPMRRKGGEFRRNFRPYDNRNSRPHRNAL